MIRTYTSAFGVFEIPVDIYIRSVKYRLKGVRTDYLDQWCEYQWKKANR